MRRRTLLLLITATSLVMACGAGSGEAASDSGIRGTVSSGPQCPLVQEDSPCPDVPWIGQVHIVGGPGVEIDVTTSDDGSFAAQLDPGTYEVEPLIERGGPPTAAPQVVVVRPHDYSEVSLTVDTGIR